MYCGLYGYTDGAKAIAKKPSSIRCLLAKVQSKGFTVGGENAHCKMDEMASIVKAFSVCSFKEFESKKACIMNDDSFLFPLARCL